MMLTTTEREPLSVTVNDEGKFIIPNIEFAIWYMPPLCKFKRGKVINYEIIYYINKNLFSIKINWYSLKKESTKPSTTLTINIDMCYYNEVLYVYDIQIEDEANEKYYYHYISSNIIPLLHGRKLTFDNKVLMHNIAILLRNISTTLLYEKMYNEVDKSIYKYINDLRKKEKCRLNNKIRYTEKTESYKEKQDLRKKIIDSHIIRLSNFDPIKKVISGYLDIDTDEISIHENKTVFNVYVNLKNDTFKLGDMYIKFDNDKNDQILKFELMPFIMYYLRNKFKIGYQAQLEMNEQIDKLLNKLDKENKIK